MIQPQDWKRDFDHERTMAIMGYRHMNCFTRIGQLVIVSRVRMENGDEWNEISVSRKDKKTPTWEQMCAIKRDFVGDDAEAIQVHPMKADYVNLAEVLHLWVPIGVFIAVPNLKKIVAMEKEWE